MAVISVRFNEKEEKKIHNLFSIAIALSREMQEQDKISLKQK